MREEGLRAGDEGACVCSNSVRVLSERIAALRHVLSSTCKGTTTESE